MHHRRLISTRTILALGLAGTALTGCSTLDRINPFSHKTLKAPCNAIASTAEIAATCTPKAFDDTMPSAEDLLILRGSIDPETGRATTGIIVAAP